MEKIKKTANATFIEENPDKNFERAKSTKQLRVQTMYSNIFHDPNKHKLKEKIDNMNLSVREEKEAKEKGTEAKKYPATPKSNYNKTRTSAKFDWKSTNSELLFRASSRQKNEKINPKTMRLNDMKSAFGPEISYLNTEEREKPVYETAINEKVDKEVMEKMKEKFTNNGKLSKTLHNLSTMHDKDFYKNSLNRTSQNKLIQKFEIDNINYESFNLKEFKTVFNTNGIHVFEVNLQGNYGNGNSKGVLTYKIRKNEDIDGFNEKLDKINEKITKQFKIDLKVKVDTNKRPMTENMPSNLVWNNVKMNNYTQHRKVDKTNQSEQKSKLDVSERFASNRTAFDHSYKNSHSKKHFEKNLKK